MHAKTISVVLADGQVAMRELLADRLTSERDFTVLSQTSDAAEGVRETERLKPDLLLVDSVIGGRVTFDTMARLSRSAPRCGIVLVSAIWTDGHLRQAMSIRVRGYLLKTEPIERLVGAIRRAAAGDRVFSAAISDRLMTLRSKGQDPGEVIIDPAVRKLTQTDERDPETSDSPQAPGGTSPSGDAFDEDNGFVPPRLSNREREVLGYVAVGYSRRDIARKMHISENTVANHVAKIMSKLDIHDRVELTRYAIREGLVEP